jgi:transglutaminase-like putative cysteine protease
VGPRKVSWIRVHILSALFILLALNSLTGEVGGPHATYKEHKSIDEPLAVTKIQFQEEAYLSQTNAEEIDKFPSKYLKEGKYTKVTPEIKALADKLFREEKPVYVLYASNDVVRRVKSEVLTPSDLLVEYTTTDNPVRDYIVRALVFVADSIAQPFPDSSHDYELFNRLSAEEVLENRVGYCDERVILFRSLMIARGIPARIVVREWSSSDGLKDEYPHVEAEVYYDGKWVKVDPSYKLFGMWAANGRDLTEEVGASDW